MDSLTQLRAVLCLMALMGLGWIAGAFTIDGPSGLVFQYIFTITNISQVLTFYHHQHFTGVYIRCLLKVQLFTTHQIFKQLHSLLIINQTKFSLSIKVFILLIYITRIYNNSLFRQYLKKFIVFCFQGILIFYFHCASKPDVRSAWFKSFRLVTMGTLQ